MKLFLSLILLSMPCFALQYTAVNSLDWKNESHPLYCASVKIHSELTADQTIEQLSLIINKLRDRLTALRSAKTVAILERYNLCFTQIQLLKQFLIGLSENPRRWELRNQFGRLFIDALGLMDTFHSTLVDLRRLCPQEDFAQFMLASMNEQRNMQIRADECFGLGALSVADYYARMRDREEVFQEQYEE